MRDLRPMFFHKMFLALALAVSPALPADVLAQAGGFQDLLGLKGKRGSAQSPADFSASLVPDGQPGEVALRISVKLPPDHYIYSTTPGQGAETKITFNRVEGLEAIDDDFRADHPPKTEDDKYLGTLEKYYNKVTWSRRYRIEPGVDPENVSVAGLVKYQVCDKQSCRPNLKYEFDVKLASAGPPSPATRSRPAQPVTGASASTTGSARFEQLVGKKGSKTSEGTWRVLLNPRQARPGDVVTITVEAVLNPGWHVYALDQQQLPNGSGPLPTAMGLTKSEALIPLDGQFIGPEPIEVASEAWEGLQERYHEGTVQWKRRFRIAEGQPEGDVSLTGMVAWMMCNSAGCQPATGFEFGGTLVVADNKLSEAEAFAITRELNQRTAGEAIDELRAGAGAATPSLEDQPPPNSRDTPNDGIRGSTAGLDQSHARAEDFHGGVNAPVAKPRIDRSQGLLVFLAIAASFGFAALLTPCVFPMIPITVSFFQKQSEKQHHRPFTMALVYCLGIMGTFTGLGMLMSIIFGAGALNQLSNSIVLNVFIAAVLLFFALNLLGLFEIRMPSWLLTYTAGKESRGGYVGVVFMALTFTLTSFTCTFAFAGLLLVEAMRGDRLWPILGLLSFSAAFSLPFFFLALFPSFLQKLPKSGGWMNVVKVIMGLIELAAAFKYLGTADQSWNGQPAIFDFHLMISAWAVISIAAALYLLGLFRLPHDTASDHIGVVRFMSAMGFFGFASYLGVGLFGAEKPQGMIWKYTEALANTTFEGGTDPTGPYLQHGDLKYALDFERALDFAIAEDKPLFLDFTGVNCANCRLMEKGPMSQPRIKEQLSRFVRTQLFTDALVPTIPDRNEAERLREFNARLQLEWFGDVTLPEYVIIPPDREVLKDQSRILSALEGKNDEADFAAFLERGWRNWQKVQASRAGRQVGRR